jgi:hypothetical protein
LPTVAVVGALLEIASAWPQATENAAAFDVTLTGPVTTIEPDPLALSLLGLYVVATGWLPALAKFSVCVAPFPPGSFQ